MASARFLITSTPSLTAGVTPLYQARGAIRPPSRDRKHACHSACAVESEPSNTSSRRTPPFARILGRFTSSYASVSGQPRRFLDTLQGYLLEVQRILIQLHRSANKCSAPFVDHAGILCDSKTGRPINGHGHRSDESGSDYEDTMPGYSFLDSSDVDLLGRRMRSMYSNIGKVLLLFDY
ncbi:hypothetical protein BDR03DRAFT_1003824 [Suillus americanus]|nr:hypothetical protein BDR03DRAFT_1003824 [Suillus americanus]